MNESDANLRRLAYSKVAQGSGWILSLAEEGRPYDNYTTQFGDANSFGVMPSAEMVMCLCNLREYLTLRLPQPTTDLINRSVTRLLEIHGQRGFSGRPYLINPGTEDPPFTDAVCFLAGAVTAALTQSGLDADLKGSASTVLIECTKWLLEGSITPPQNLPLKGAGWSWSSPVALESSPTLTKAFGRVFPPQTYFTASAFTTLSEALFDQYSLIDNAGLTQDVLTALVDAKTLFLSSLFTTETGTTGWCDFGVDLDREEFRLLSDLMPAALQDRDLGQVAPSAEFTLYPLEPLSYIVYYLTDDRYAGVVQKLRQEAPDTLKNLAAFSNEDRQKLHQAFSLCVGLAKNEKIPQKFCRIQLPQPLNGKDLNTNGYYLDGTVGYNALNVLNFYCRSFESGADQAVVGRWEARQGPLVKRLLEGSFKKYSFAHCGDPQLDELFEEAIYATRTAIAALLAWGLEPVTAQDQIVPVDVRELVTRLYQILCDPLAPGTTGQPPAGAVSPKPDEVTKMVDLGYLLGLGAHRMRNVKNWGIYLTQVTPTSCGRQKQHFQCRR